MGISLIHAAFEIGLVLCLMRTLTYWWIAASPDNRGAKFLAYTFC